MGIYHLISIAEDQLRGWHGDHDELLRNLGSAVALACLDPELSGVDVRDAEPESPTTGAPASAITVKHVDSFDSDDFIAWVWARSDEVCIAADIEKSGLVSLGKMVNALLKSRFGEGERTSLGTNGQ
jgi:hypothetical protein